MTSVFISIIDLKKIDKWFFGWNGIYGFYKLTNVNN